MRQATNWEDDPNIRTPRTSRPGGTWEDPERIPPKAWLGAAAFVAGAYVFIKVAHAAGFF